jgi:hypothetical protein
MASFILYRCPSLLPPNSSQLSLKGNTVDYQYPQTHLTYNRLYEPWCDYLANLFLANQVNQDGNVCYFSDSVSEEFLDQLTDNLFVIEESA